MTGAGLGKFDFPAYRTSTEPAPSTFLNETPVSVDVFFSVLSNDFGNKIIN